MTEARAQAADRHTARAVLLEPTPPITIGAPGGGDQAWALARWAGTGAAPRTGEILATLARPLAAWLPCGWTPPASSPDRHCRLPRPPTAPSQPPSWRRPSWRYRR